jgi:hypothetical protein
MRCRKNISKHSADEKESLRLAFLKLKDASAFPSTNAAAQADGAVSKYDDYVWIHHDVMMKGGGHQEPSFLPWHREFLRRIEIDLRAASLLTSKPNPDLTLPYWSWSKAHGSADPGYPFVTDILGGNGNPVTTGDFKHSAGNWSLTVEESPVTGDLFTPPHDGSLGRTFGVQVATLPAENDVKTALSRTIYDSSPWDTTTTLANSFRNSIEGWNNPAGPQNHNRVHVWVGGSMLPGTSPNDPVFFLNHCNIDRLWAVWLQKHPASEPYLPLDSEPASPNYRRLNDDLADFPGVTPASMINHKPIAWYDSDLPEIEAPAPSLDFINIPEGLTSYKAVSFKITGCRRVKFHITGMPTGQFGLTPMGSDFVAEPVDGAPFYYGYVWVQVTSVAGPIANSSVAIHAFIEDEEGFFVANDGDPFALGDYTVTLTATSMARENNAIALVLDRSGSMSSPAGGTSTRSQLLGGAIGVFRDLMLPNDEVAVVTFDDMVDTPITMQKVSGAPSFSTVDITPRNDTWIGGGIQQGAVQLGLATHPNKAMIVLTDGNENVHPYIVELPAGTVTNRTFAIGLGLPGDVSDAALQQITSATNGNLIITGLMSSDEQRFNLTKYFVQVLAGVLNSQVILDPNGKLYFGSRDVIPFRVTEADVYVDAITLCPLPMYLEFVLQTPDGKIIKPTTPGPNVQYIMGQQVLCYRMVLPALPADASGSHGGTWKAILALKDKDAIERLGKDRDVAVSPNVHRGFLPYSFLVHTTSNLQFSAWMMQESFKPGAKVSLYATLKEYDVSMVDRATVWAEIARPDGGTFSLDLQQRHDGTYSASFATSMAGVYFCRVRAEGYSSKGRAFTREKMLTAGVYYGRYDPLPPPDPGELICRLLHCILEEHEVFSPAAQKRFGEMGFDFKRMVECIEEVCPELPTERDPNLKYKLLEKVLAKPQLASQVKFRNAGATKPVKPKPVAQRTKPMLPFMPSLAPTGGMAMPGMGDMKAAPAKTAKKKKQPRKKMRRMR